MSWEIKQRVNFYLDEFQPPKIPDDLKMILIGAGLHVGIAVVVLLGLVINWYWQGHRLEGMQERQAIVEQQVANIESERPPLKLDDALVAQRAKLREDLESSQRILRYLTQQELDSSTSFTTMVKELGDQDVRGVWLKSFAFYDEGRHINISGFTDDPAKISRYVSDLLKRSGFSEQAFRFVDVRKQEDSRWLTFKLDTRPREKEKPAEPRNAALTSAELMRRAREGVL